MLLAFTVLADFLAVELFSGDAMAVVKAAVQAEKSVRHEGGEQQQSRRLEGGGATIRLSNWYAWRTKTLSKLMDAGPYCMRGIFGIRAPESGYAIEQSAREHRIGETTGRTAALLLEVLNLKFCWC